MSVEVDTTALERGARQLAAGLERASARVGSSHAAQVASTVRARVPVRSGRLRSTVVAAPTTNGGTVSYGGGLPYANYIEHRTGAVAGALAGAPQAFGAALTVAAAAEVNRL
jgi:Bacteriophage HK97-gp10, putative tail-component